MYSHEAAVLVYPDHERRVRWANREGWKYQDIAGRQWRKGRNIR